MNLLNNTSRLRLAIEFTNRTYLFVNSEIEFQGVAEITKGQQIEIKSDNQPLWLKKYVLDKLS